MSLHTFVDFHADFSLPESCTGFPDSEETIPGKEPAEYLAAELRVKGFDVGDPEPADFEYVIDWASTRQKFELHVGVDDFSEMDRWIVQASVQRRGFFGGSLGKDDVEELAGLLAAVDQVFQESPRIRDVRWFPSFEQWDERDRQTAYAGPTSDEPVWQPEVTPVYRLIMSHRRLRERAGGFRLVVCGVIAGLFLFIVLHAAGLAKLAPIGILVMVLPVAACFIAFGTAAWLHGLDLFQQRRQAGSVVGAWVGLVLFFLGGAFFVCGGAGALWGVVRAWPG